MKNSESFPKSVSHELDGIGNGSSISVSARSLTRTTNRLLVATKILLVLSLVFSAAIAYPEKHNSEIFESVQASFDVPLETNPTSTFWKEAKPAYIAETNWGKPLPAYKTKVLSRWTKNNLYFLFVCPYQKLNLKPNPNTKIETNQLWNWDVAEIFIGWDFQHIHRYKEFEISPQGEWMDLDISPGKHDWSWNSGLQVISRINRKSKIWYGAIRIPFAAIDPRPPQVGTTFRANLFRTEDPSGNPVLLTWKPTMNDSFHVPERFGRIILAAPKKHRLGAH